MADQPADDGWDFDDAPEDNDCYACGGDGYVECPHPMECTRSHICNDTLCPCGSCNGSGLAKERRYAEDTLTPEEAATVLDGLWVKPFTEANSALAGIRLREKLRRIASRAASGGAGRGETE